MLTDPGAWSEAQNELKDIHLILITHERDVAEHASRIIHIKDGLLINDSDGHARRIIHRNHHKL